MAEHYFPVPEQVPRNKPGFGRWLGTTVMRLFGWRIEGELPDMPRVLMIVAPHSSGWDAVWGLALKLAIGLRLEFMAKRELFFWPLGPLLRYFGGMPINRKSPRGAVGAAVAEFKSHRKYWYVIAPEGTRKAVKEWRTGFWYIANEAKVPILCCYFHYPRKVIGFGLVVHTSDDMRADMAKIREFYIPWQGKNRDSIYRG